MKEPTKKQHDILYEVNENYSVQMINSNEKIDKYWELVRMGYLKNLVSLGLMYDWKFVLSEEGEKYINQ